MTVQKYFSRILVAAAATLALLLSASGPSVFGAPLRSGEAKTQVQTPSLVKAYDLLPLSFEINRGQADRQVEFLGRGQGYTLFLTHAGEATLALRKSAPEQKPLDLSRGDEGRVKGLGAQAVLRMTLVGANADPQIQGLGELPGKTNYIVGNDPRKWLTRVPTYARVNYRSVYPGVDLLFYGMQRQLEYDFVVAPGADPSSVTFGFEGAEKLTLDSEGNLVVAIAGGELVLRRPVIYQDVEGERRNLRGSYALKGTRHVGFHVGAYDAARPLVIDPVLSYSTYLGGSRDEDGKGIATDGSGSAYVTGFTASVDFPTSSGAAQPVQADAGSSFDVFVTKLNPSGSGLVYSTYLGGNSDDEGVGIAVDTMGNAYVTGFTSSTNFPITSPAFQTNKASGYDGFVSKLDTSGSLLAYSTYLGGSGNDFAQAIGVDAADNAYVTGYTQSFNFPTTSGAFQTTNAGPFEVFVTKLNVFGSGLVYSTYLGGGTFDFAYGIAIDASSNAYVTGRTASTDYPTTPGAFQPTAPSAGAFYDAFVSKLNPTGSALAYSTYLGGSSHYDQANAIAVDTGGNAYVTGYTFSNNFPATVGAFQTSTHGAVNAFVTKLDPAGAALVYSTYLGGGGNGDGGAGIAVDSAGNAYVCGSANSSNFPTVNPIQATKSGGFDSFVTKVNPFGSGLVYSTYLGGSGDDLGAGIALDPSFAAYVTGVTLSSNFPTSVGSFQITRPGARDAFVAKIADVPPCVPQPEVCDGSDNDCDGSVDEGTSGQPTTCGVGACASTGVTTCNAGAPGNTCSPGTPSAEVCDGSDNDCDGSVDEGTSGQPTTCGVGACASTGVTTCDAGTPGNTCSPGTPSPEFCDGSDNDCDGSVDEGTSGQPTTCGVGACASTGVTTCNAGAPGNTCTPGSPSPESCNGIDDDCNGLLPSTEADADGDGYRICQNDCNDADSAVNPAATESCANAFDDDCDGQVNETCAASCVGNSPPVVTSTSGPSGPIPLTAADTGTVTANFTDANIGQTHTCTINWDDGSITNGTVAESGGSGTCSGSHTYSAAAVYSVTFTISDGCADGTGSFQFVVVYDPNGSFVTGGGWINSPPEAYAPNPGLTGAANFGFVSKYQKSNSTIPTGETQFHFNTAGFRFDSDSYEWLVISGAKARYRGAGSVNGVAGYGFELTAWDGQVNGGGGVDRFRMKVWQGNPTNMIYDNERTRPDGADPVTALQGGSIVIHKK